MEKVDIINYVFVISVVGVNIFVEVLFVLSFEEIFIEKLGMEI